MALVGKELASDAMLDKVLWVSSGRRLIETCTKGLTYKVPSHGVVTTETGMNFSHCCPSSSEIHLLKYCGSAFLVELSVVDLVGFRTMQQAPF